LNKIGPGGETPFPIPTKPNVFTPLRNEELLERRGESALWFRMSPCPCPQQDRVPDCKLCYEGEIRTFQEDLEIYEEISWKVDGNRVYTRYGPIESVKSISLLARGETKPLVIKKINDSFIELDSDLPYYYQVQLDYKVKLVETIAIEMVGNNEHLLISNLSNRYIIGVEELYHVEDEKSFNQRKVDWKSFNLNSITLNERTSGKYRAKVKVINPVKVAYKTFTIEKRQGLSSSLVQLPDGEILAVMGSGYKMGEGDIITLLFSTVRHSQFVPFKAGNFDRLPFTPISDVNKIISKDTRGLKEYKQGIDFVIFGDSRIQWLTDKPRDGYTIIYDYHPTFRVTGFVEGGSGEDRPKPRQFKMKAIPSFHGNYK